MKNILYFILSFLVVFFLGLSSLKAADLCDVFYESKTGEKIAYSCFNEIGIIIGFDEKCMIYKNRPLPLVPYFKLKVINDKTVILPGKISKERYETISKAIEINERKLKKKTEEINLEKSLLQIGGVQ
jgi:hypothetical protein